ncbi:MAG TPA: hypothetical protein VFE51_01170 [Verrucomicrobiae bacterium]|nr:hypothetical protein [Verrucomicrobiae bacterium]
MVKSSTNAIATAAGTSTNALRDIKPPVEIPSGWAWVLWLFGALALAALGLWLWKYWKAQRARVLITPPVPAHLRAKQRLADALALIGQPKEFCIAVSDTLRWYLEERFDFRAPERTTEEFLNELRATTLLTPDQKESLVDFLNRCDLVKFAKYEPREPELRDLHASAVRLVEETEPIAGTEMAQQPGSSGSDTRSPALQSVNK